MTNNAFNPFSMPGFGQGGSESAVNPLIASMEMMRHAMAGLSGQSAGTETAGVGGINFAQALNPEEIERRINELKVVENWLKLNLSMLTSTIQGLEVQLATIQTLKSFAAMGAGVQAAVNAAQTPSSSATGVASGSFTGQSPLEAVLGMPPSVRPANPENLATPQSTSEQDAQQDAASASASTKHSDALSQSTPQVDAPPAGQAWWKMLERQFSQISEATTQATQVATDAAAQLTMAATPKVASKKPSTAKKASPKAPSARQASAAKASGSKTSANKTSGASGSSASAKKTSHLPSHTNPTKPGSSAT